MFYNNLLTIPVLFVCSFVFENWSSENIAKNFPLESRNKLALPIIGKFFPKFELVDIDAGHWVISEQPEAFRKGVL